MKLLRARPAFSLVEVLLAATIFAFLTITLTGALIYGRTSTAAAGEDIRGAYILDQTFNAVTNIRNASYANLTNGTYGLTQTANSWAFSATPDIINGFTRQVTIADGGTNRKTISSSVSWNQGANVINSTSLLTNWAANIATWANATHVGTINTSGTIDGLKVATVGNYAYIITNTTTAGLVIANISTPTAPTVVGTMNLTSAPTNIFISGNYAYVTQTGNTSELQIINISNPTAPTITGTFDAAGTADGRSIFVSGNYAYMARGANGGANEFQVINISNPATPTLTGAYGNNIIMNDVVVSGNYAFVGTSSTTQEVLVINITTPATPSLTTSYNLATAGTVNALASYGTTLYIAQGTSLHLRNVTTVTAPTAIGSIVSTGAAVINDIAINGTNQFIFLATANTSAELQIVNVTTPATPTMADTVNMTGNNSLLGVAYSTAFNIVVGASNSDTGEVGIFIPN